VCALLRPDAPGDVRSVLARAGELGVAAEDLSAYCDDTRLPGIVLGYGSVPTERVATGLRLLTRSFRDVMGRGGTARPSDAARP
jgi:hypothetical protein